MFFPNHCLHLSLLILVFTKNLAESNGPGDFIPQDNEYLQNPLSSFKFGHSYVSSVLPVKICPPQNPSEISFDENHPQYKCNFAHWDKKDDFQCNRPLYPVLARELETNKFQCLTWMYNVCSLKYERRTEFLEEELHNYKESDENDKKLALDEAFPMKIYTLCSSTKHLADTIFTIHVITSTPLSPKHVALPNVPIEAYKKENQEDALKIIFNSDNIEDKDFLKPQMIAHSNDILPDFARGSYHMPLNIKPQWNSLIPLWNEIIQYIWYAMSTRNWAAVNFTGATGTTEINGKQVSIGKYQPENEQEERKDNEEEIKNKTENDTESTTDKNSRLYPIPSDSGPQRIPRYWWRLIHVLPDRNIIVVMHNKALGSDQPIINKACPINVCLTYGWKGIIKIARKYEYATLYCCEVTEETLSNLEVPEIAEKIKIGHPLDLNLEGEDLEFIKYLFDSVEVNQEQSIKENPEHNKEQESAAASLKDLEGKTPEEQTLVEILSDDHPKPSNAKNED